MNEELKNIDFETYSTRQISPEQELPWDFINIGVKKDFLNASLERTFMAIPPLFS